MKALCNVRTIVLLITMTLVSGYGDIAIAADNLEEIRQVLLLNSYDQRMTWVKDIVSGVESVLHPENNNLAIHIENMDSKVFHSEEYFDEFAQYLRVKYRGVPISLILCSDNNAYDFLRIHRDTLFPGVPVSFCGVNDFSADQLAGLRGFTGVAEIFSARETVALALQLHPNTTEIFVINDYLKTGRAWAKDIDQKLKDFSGKLKIHHSGDLPISELMEHIANLGPGTIVLLGGYYSDRDGRYFTYERIGAMLAEASKVPVYCLLEFNIGKGVVGGRVISGYYQGRTMADLGKKILAGADPVNLPVIMQGSNRLVFDYFQLMRFSIDESALPPESHIINRPYSFYDEYKAEVWVVAGFIVVLIASILALGANFLWRLRVEGALRASEKRFRQLANATWEAIVVHEKGVLFHANDCFYEMFGYTQEELKGKQIMPLILAADCVDEVKNRIEKGLLVPYEGLGLRKNGQTFPLEIRVREMEYEGRDVRMAAIRDLSERKRMEERLTQSQKLEAIGTLAGGIAHDFNNILSAIIGYSELTLLKLQKGSEQAKYIDEVLRAGNRARDLVEQILTFARKAKEEKRPVQVSLIVKEALKLLRATLPTSIEIKHDIDSSACVLSDATQVHQIIMNLCTNARKAMEDGGILRVSLKEVDLDEEFISRNLGVTVGRYLQLTVSDTGVGIPESIRIKIFDPFFTTRSKGEGTGLGLSVVHGIVKDCQGLITVTSEVGKGSTFHVYLPVMESGSGGVSIQKEELKGGNERVMFVDDEEILASMAEAMLTSLGYSVTVFTSSPEALYAFQKEPDGYDLVVTDMTMPKLSGAKLAAEILAIRPEMPVIICTGYSENFSRDEALKAGMRNYVMKPVVMAELAAIIREALDGPLPLAK